MRKTIVLVLASVLLLAGCQSTDGAGRTVTVSGSGEVSISPDMATFSVSVEETGETTAQAQEAANVKMAQICAILQEEFLLDDDDIRTTGMSLYPQYRYEDGVQVLTGQAAGQSISVTVHDLDQLAPIVDRLSTVSGISLSSISLDAQDKEASLSEARLEAIADASARAADYAGAAGLTLGEALVIQESGSYYGANRIQPAVLYAAADESASAKASFHAGDITVSASVNVTFEMH